MKLLPIKRRRIAEDTREAATKAIANDYPFVMVAKRPDGEWEISCWFTKDKTYEVVGAMEEAKRQLLTDDDDD